MLIGRNDIIGDLARLRNDFTNSVTHTENVLARLEVLAAAPVQLGMSYNIVDKASGIPRDRIQAVLDARPSRVGNEASNYERHPSGVVGLRDR